MNCISCKDNYYKFYNNENQCEQLQDLYYLDGDTLKECYQRCETCSNGYDEDNQNMNCISCKDQYYLDDNNCREECDFYYYRNSNNKKICIDSCNGYTYTFENQCLNDCKVLNLKIEENKCVNKCSSKYYDNKGECTEITDFIDGSLNQLMNDLSNLINILPFNSPINGNGYSLEIINTNEFYTEKYNLSIIHLGECENILKKQYGLSGSDYLLIAKIDIKSDDSNTLTNVVKYKVFDLNGNELDLSYCSNSKITIEYAINTANSNINFTYAEMMFELDVDVFNSKDEYFNNICVISKGNDSDISISKRRENQYINISFCDDECEYQSINYTTMKAICDCDVESNSLNDNQKKNQVKNAFTNSIPVTNIIIAKCYKIFFSFKDVFHNIGFCFYSCLIIIDVIIFIHYSLFAFKKLKSLVLDNIYEIKSNPPPKITISSSTSSENIHLESEQGVNKEIKNQNHLYKMISQNSNASNRILNLKNDNLNNTQIITSPKKNNLSSKDSEISFQNIQFPIREINMSTRRNILSPKKNNLSPRKSNISPRKNDLSPRKSNFSPKRNEFSPKRNNFSPSDKKKMGSPIKLKIKKSSQKDINIGEELKELKTETNLLKHIGISGNIKNPKKYESTVDILYNIHKKDNLIHKDDEDINNIPFFKAKNEDNRNFFKMYCDFIIENQSLISSFIKKSKYDILNVKITCFLTSLSIDFWLNAIFYNDDIVDEKYENGNISFLTEFLKSFYSCLVGFILFSLINKLSLYTYYFEILNKELSPFKDNSLEICEKFLRKVKIQLLILFSFNFIIMFWMIYYCTLFCYIYKHNQMDWFIGGWISFLISLLTFIIISFCISCLRYYSIRKKHKYIYNISCYLSRFA